MTLGAWYFLFPCTKLGHYTFVHLFKCSQNLPCFISGVRQEQDIYVRLIDSVTKQVKPSIFSTSLDYVKYNPTVDCTVLVKLNIC